MTTFWLVGIVLNVSLTAGAIWWIIRQVKSVPKNNTTLAQKSKTSHDP